MSYSQAYYLDCEKPIDVYNPDCCIPVEFGRVRSVAFIRKAYLQQILSNPRDLTKWQDGVANGSIAIIPFTSGSFDAGKPGQLKGYGRRLSTHSYRDMRLNFSIPFSFSNYSFFDNLDKFTDLVPAFRTETLLHICNNAADILTQEVVEDDLETRVSWNIECTIRSKNIPLKVDASGLMSLFVCADCTTVEFSDEFSCEFN
jgi:hypothetical protein